MKLIRHGEPGKEKPGVILGNGSLLDVSAFGGDYDEAFFASGGTDSLQRWLSVNGSNAPILSPDVRLGPPICRPSKIVCIGLNFRDHAAGWRFPMNR
jgi:2,4-didehydro-3-deoxy-L-rhamnonate hydrolase